MTSANVPRAVEISPEYYSIPAAVKASSISRAGLYRALQCGQLAAVKIGRRTLIKRSALEEWIDAHAAWTPETAGV